MSDSNQITGPKNFTDSIAYLDTLTTQKAEQWVKDGRRIWAIAVVGMMMASFYSVYFSQKKRKLGVPGLFLAVNAMMTPFLTYAKYWERKRNQPLSQP